MTEPGSISSHDLVAFSDRLTDLKRSLEHLYDSECPVHYLTRLEDTVDAARALFADDMQTSTFKNMQKDNTPIEPMLQTPSGYEFMDDKIKARMYWLRDLFGFKRKVFFFHPSSGSGRLYEGVEAKQNWHDMQVQGYELVPLGPGGLVVNAREYRDKGIPLPSLPSATSSGKRPRQP